MNDLPAFLFWLALYTPACLWAGYAVGWQAAKIFGQHHKDDSANAGTKSEPWHWRN